MEKARRRGYPCYNGAMRRWWWFLLLALGVGFLFRYWHAVVEAVYVLRQGLWWWIGLAVLFHLGWVAHTTLLLWGLYRVLGLSESPLRLGVMVLSSHFINLAAPTGGVSGLAFLAADAHRRGKPASRALVAATLYIFYEHLGFLLVMFVGLWVLVRRNRLTWTELSAAAVMVLIVLGLFVVVALGLWAPTWLERLLAALARKQPRFVLRRRGLSRFQAEMRVRRFVRDLTTSLAVFRSRPRLFLLFYGIATTAKLWHLGVMACAFFAFHLPLSPGTLLGAYMVGHLFLVVSPVPGGIGFAEGAIIVLLTSFGFALQDAFVVAMTYRAVTFWLPFFVGMLGFRYLARTGSAPAMLPGSVEMPRPHEVGRSHASGLDWRARLRRFFQRTANNGHFREAGRTPVQVRREEAVSPMTWPDASSDRGGGKFLPGPSHRAGSSTSSEPRA